MSPDDLSTLQPATLVVSGGRPDPTPGAPVAPPIVLTSTYAAGGDLIYARGGNPAWEPFEEILGALEGGSALLFSSGMAAIHAALRLVPVGSTIVAPAGPYNGVHQVLTLAHERGEFVVRWVDSSDTEATIAALDGADLLWIESPINPLLTLTDIAAVTAAAHERGAIVVCDNTFATPLNQRPLTDGVDVVVHSVTKYLSGHSDLILGACVTAATERGVAAHASLAETRLLEGAIPGAVEAWLAARGVRTLSVRMERATRNGRCSPSRSPATRMRRNAPAPRPGS